MEQLAAERACRRLLLDLVRHLDLGEPGSAADLFTEDGTWAWPEGDRLVEGRAALRAHYDAHPADRHTRRLMADVQVDITSPDTATATSYFTTYRVDHDVSPAPGAGHPVRIGHYQDTLRRTSDGAWLLVARTLHHPSDGPTPRL